MPLHTLVVDTLHLLTASSKEPLQPFFPLFACHTALFVGVQRDMFYKVSTRTGASPRKCSVLLALDMGVGQINHQGTAGFSPCFNLPGQGILGTYF